MTGPSVLHATSIDNVKQRQSTVTAFLQGEKRSHEQCHASSPRGAIFRDVTNAANAQDNAKWPRPRAITKNRIEASRICSIDKESNAPNLQCNSERPPAPIPALSQNPLLSLRHPCYGLPEELVNNFASLGINDIYPWQSSCLLGRGLLDGEKNLVYSAPTGGGKSLVADVLMLKKIINDPSKKAILVLPYVALVQEKLKWLRKVVDGVSKKVDGLSQSSSQIPRWKQRHSSSVRMVGFFGGSRARANWSDFDVAVYTIEKVGSPSPSW